MSPRTKFTTTALTAAITLATVAATSTTVSAHDVRWHKWAHQHGVHNHPVHRHVHRKRVVRNKAYGHSQADAAQVGGILAGILGVAIVVDALSNADNAHGANVAPKQFQDSYKPASEYPPAPGDPLVVYHTQSLEPWTPGWRAWCEQRFRTFNHQTGTYRGYDGYDHFCVPK